VSESAESSLSPLPRVHNCRHPRTQIIVNVPGDAGAFLQQEPAFLLVQRQLGHEAETDQNDQCAHDDQCDLEPATLPEKGLDRLATAE